MMPGFSELNRLTNGAWNQLRASVGLENEPRRSPDGSALAYLANFGQALTELFRVPSDGGSPPELLASGATRAVGLGAATWSAGNEQLLVAESQRPGTLWVVQSSGGAEPQPWTSDDRFGYAYPRLSPDGKWVAYERRDVTGIEIVVSPFSAASTRFQVSSGGGRLPRWRADGRELFYLALDNRMMVVEVTTVDGAFRAAAPRALFQSRALLGTNTVYDVSSDGQRFLILTGPTVPATDSISMLVNWSASVARSESRRD